MNAPDIKVPEPKIKLKLDYEAPIWSGLPPAGAKLEILKGGAIIKEIPLKDKQYFVFGRHEESVDVLCEHGSISRMHLILQFKDNGDAYIFDLGSTHGSYINKREIPKNEHVKLNNSDLFKLGQSTRLYIYSYDAPEEQIEEESISTKDNESKESRKQRMLKLYEDKVKKDEQIKSDMDNDGKATWGISFDNDDSTRKDQARANKISDEDIKRFGLQYGQKINYEALKSSSDLSDIQKNAIKKAESTEKRIEKLTKELEGIQAKQAQMLDLTQGQQERYYKIENELEQLRETLDHQEDNIRNMVINGTDEDNYDEVKNHRDFYKQWESQDYDDEFYDRSKTNKFNKRTQKRMTKADLSSGDTYESVKIRLDLKMKERDALMKKMIDINYEEKQKRKQQYEGDDYDELDAFMDQNNKKMKSDEKQFVKDRLNEVNQEIEKCNSMLTLLMPSSFSTAKKAEPVKATPDKPKVTNTEKLQKKQKNNPQGGLSSVLEKLSSMAKTKEQELKYKQQQSEIAESSVHSYDTPRFQNNDSYHTVSVTDVNSSDQQLNQNESNEPKNFFSEIVSNIKAVGDNENIDISKYSMFVEQYHDEHRKQPLENEQSNKRQKIDENEENTVIKFGS